MEEKTEEKGQTGAEAQQDMDPNRHPLPTIPSTPPTDSTPSEGTPHASQAQPRGRSTPTNQKHGSAHQEPPKLPERTQNPNNHRPLATGPSNRQLERRSYWRRRRRSPQPHLRRRAGSNRQIQRQTGSPIQLRPTIPTPTGHRGHTCHSTGTHPSALRPSGHQTTA